MGNKERILKNTAFLYLRSIVSMLLRLYTSRLVLQALGVEDFGVYQAVGGLVAMTSFLTSTLSVASNRFISYELGHGDSAAVNRVFSTLVNIHFIFSLVILLLIETAGLYFLYNNLDIGSMSVKSATWVLHFSALSLVLSINSVPYNCMLISKENMSYFAYIDIFGEILKLLVAISLALFSGERIIYYAALMFAQASLIQLIYVCVCRKKYDEARYRFIHDVSLLRRIAAFSGWTSLASFSSMIKTQGVTLVINLYIGPLLNAAVGIANQVNNAVRTFSTNFQMSFVPQIIKSYAVDDYGKMNRLTTSGAKLSTYLITIFAVPLMLESDYVLGVWLVDVPEHASVIVVLILIETMVQTMTCTGNTAIRATGKVAMFEVVYNVCELLALPFMLVWMNYSAEYYIPFVTMIVFMVLSSFVKVFFLKRQVPQFNMRNYVLGILFKCPMLAILASGVAITVQSLMAENFARLVVVTIVFELVFGLSVYIVGLNSEEKVMLRGLIKKIKK